MQTKLKVAHLSDMPFGGAAVAAQRLVRGLADTNAIEVEHWVFGNEAGSRLHPSHVSLEKNCPKTALERGVRVFSRAAAKALQRRRQRSALLMAIATRQPDILHLHNLHASALRHEDLTLIPSHVHLVWTMHDCWPWAPYAYRWINEDGTEEVQGAERRSNEVTQEAREHLFSIRKDTVLVSPSRWLAQQAQSNTSRELQIKVIPYGVPIEAFKPIPKEEAKAMLGLDRSKIWLGLSAASFDRRKGADIFVEALSMLRRKDIGVLLWGTGAPLVWPENVKVKPFGNITDAKQMATLYSACDLFVCPSRIDNLPNTILESMACGTPVVASSVGGIPDIVRAEETGWLYAPNSVQACAQGLDEALQKRAAWPAYGARCRNVVEGQFSLGRQASRYKALYSELLSHNSETTTSTT